MPEGADAGTGGNRLTQPPSLRLFLDEKPKFWASRYAPSGRKSKPSDEGRDRGNQFQQQAAEEEVVRLYVGTPEEESETIKSAAEPLTRSLRDLPSEEIYAEAVTAFKRGHLGAYALLKGELKRRVASITNKRIVDAMHPEAEETSTEEVSTEETSAGESAKPVVKKAKVVLDAAHLREDVTEAEEMIDTLKHGVKRDKQALAKVPKPVKKAILTKPSAERGPQVKKTPAPPAGKVMATKSGKKNYDYRKPAGVAKQKAGKASPQVPVTEVQPEKLAHVLQIPLNRLKKLATTKTEAEFVAYFNANGGTFLKKHKVPAAYLAEVHGALTRSAKSLNPKAEELAARGIDLAKTKAKKKFVLRPKVYKSGDDLRKLTEAMLASGVESLEGLTAFLAKGYGLKGEQASSMADELYASFVKDSAITRLKLN